MTQKTKAEIVDAINADMKLIAMAAKLSNQDQMEFMLQAAVKVAKEILDAGKPTGRK